MRPSFYAGMATSVCAVAAVAMLAVAHHPRGGSAAPEAPPSPAVAPAQVATPAPAAVTPAPRPAAKAPSPAPAAAGMVVAIDPESGELGMPSPQQLQELQSQGMPADPLSHSDEGLTVVRHPNGMLSVDLQGRFQETATIQIGPEGRKTFGCSDRPTLDPTPAPSAPAALEEE